MVVPMSQISIIAYSIMLSSSSSSSSSTVDQLDAGHRPLCPIHCARQIPITKQNQNKLINC